MPKRSKKASQSTKGFECTFCGKVLKYESGLIRHTCRIKKRFLDRDKQHVRFGYLAYRLFYEMNYARKKPPERDHFEASNLYDAFVRFGKYVVDINAIMPEEFMRYAVKSKMPIDKWCAGDKLYREYVGHLNKHEDADRALERTLLVMESWANQQDGRRLQDFFREVAPALAVQWLMSGKISPWVIFNCQSGKELLAKFSNEQLALLQKAIDMRFWKAKFVKNINEAYRIQDFLESEGI